MTREMHLLPSARAVGDFLVEELADEVLVYDQVNHRAHCLSPVAAFVWRMCDGKTSVAAAQAALSAAGHTADVTAALSHLEAAQLVEAPRPRARRIDRGRRAMFKKTAVAAGVVLASPIIFSIISPTVAEAASIACGAKSAPCCASAPKCKPGLTCIAGTCR